MADVFDVLGRDHQEVKRMLSELEAGGSSYDWLAWLTLIALGLVAAVAGFLFLPRLRARRF